MKLVDYLKKMSEGGELKTKANLGYVYIPNNIHRCLRVSQEEKMVLFNIYSLYNEEKGCAFPTQQTLAMYLGVTSSSVSKSLKSLEAKNFIQSYGKKGKKKRYIPRWDLSHNPYIVLSEAFHFATKILSKRIPDDINGDWGNKLLQLVNATKNIEFTDRDLYGNLIQKYNDGSVNGDVIYDLFTLVTQYLERTYNIIIEVNWKDEVDNYLKISKERTKKRKSNAWQNNSNKNIFLDEEEEKKTQAINQWMIDGGYIK